MRTTGVPQPSESHASARATRFSHGFLLLLGITYALIVLGALVRAHGAGLSCPDWPLCFGQIVPRFDFRIAFEWGHRVLAGSLSLGFLALALGVARDPALRRIAGIPLLVAAGLLALQIILGGLTVLHLLASWTVTAHLVTGNGFALTILWTALRLRAYAAAPEGAQAPITPVQRALISVSAAILALQIVLGGQVSSRYAGLACPDWPACVGGVFFPSFEGALGLQLAHRLNAYLLAAVVALTAFSLRAIPGLARPTALALGLVLVQIALGVANVWLQVPVEITALHSATSAALVLTLTVCVRAAWTRPLRSRDPALVRAPSRASG
jgi:cytochrome c oxidase assembly protein subunit 15